PDGTRAVSASADKSLILWNMESGRELRRLLGHQDVVNCCAFSPDGRRVLSGSSDQTLKLWDAESGAELRAFAGHQGSVQSCAFSPDGRRVLSGSYDETLKLWDAESGQLLREWQLPWAPQCVAWNPQHASLVVVALPNGTCALFNVDAGSATG
ncbi:MAG: hypothetical protein H7Z17_11775, partial [Fuerstia sp.]|nr:hypothetical protein [Fuerstiella sp.]